MKHLLLVLATFFISMNALAGGKLESGSLSPLNGVKKANFEIEFVSIHGMSETDFGNYEKDWFKDKNEVVGLILENANKKLNGLLSLGTSPSSDYTLRFVVNEISRKGNYNCDIEVLDKARNVIAKIVDIKGKGGTWGTKLNLIKDGAESVGKEFGSVLKSEIKKSKK